MNRTGVVWVWAWLVLTVVMGAWLLVDPEPEVHGRVDPTVGSDFPQFMLWLENGDG